MSLFSFIKKKKKEHEEYENLYEKIRLDELEQSAESLELDKNLIEDTYQGEVKFHSQKDKQSYVDNCCEQISIASARIEDAKKEYRIVGKYLDDILAIENADKPIKKDIMYYAKRVITLREDKKHMKQYATKISEKKYAYIQSHESQMGQILKDMQDDENYCQALKTDLHHLEGEKIALKMEKKDAIVSLRNIRKGAMYAAGFMVATIIMFFIVQQLFHVDMLIPSLSIIAIGALVAAFIVTYNQKQESELRLTERKLNKAIGLINKHKLKYVNVRSRLDYMYETHEVANSYELSEVWRVYCVVKKEREAIMKASDELYKSTESLLGILEQLKLYDVSVWPSQVEAIVDPKEMQDVRHVLNVRRQKLKSSIDFNMKTVERNKERISEIVKNNPSMAREVIATIEKYEQ